MSSEWVRASSLGSVGFLGFVGFFGFAGFVGFVGSVGSVGSVGFVRVRMPCSTPVSPGRFRTVLRCFSRGCLDRILVKRSAGLCSVPTCTNGDNASAAQLAHLKHFTVDVA